MPGLSQLKQFSNDLLSLGNENTVRAARGERPVQVVIPDGIEDKNDSEDFVLGMPEIEAEIEVAPVDEDLSDLAGLAAPSKTEGNDEPSTGFEAPDLSSLLNPVNFPDDASADTEMPDLSMFEEPEEQDEIVEEQEPEEISIADMGLDALLSGGGFDESEEPEPEPEPEPSAKQQTEQDFQEVENLDSINPFENEEVPSPVEENEIPETSFGGEELTDFGFLDNLGDSSASDIESIESGTEEFQEPEEIAEPDEIQTPEEIPADAENQIQQTEDNFDIPDSLDLGDFESLDFDNLSPDNPSETTEPEEVPDFSEPVDFDEPAVLNDFDTDSLDNADFFDNPETPDSTDFSDISEPSDNGEMSGTGESADNGEFSEPTEIPDFEDFDTSGMDNFSDNTASSPSENSDNPFSLDDLDFGSTDIPDTVDFNADEEIPDYGEETTENTDNQESVEEPESMEVFDTSEMDDIDFGIPDTDAQLSGSSPDSDFELGNADDFAMEGEFEIPGFSDVQTAKEEKSKAAVVSNNKNKNLDEPDFSQAEESEDLPPNTLSDTQYKQFLKNLGEYPLNVRLAFEDLIVQDEFTDDAEFEVIEKILNKAPARQVAGMLEKMLDTSIPVPRDFEHRTAEEYEAYKKSLSYQLRNKIIPGFLVGIAAILVLWGLFNFSKNCIYKPLKANKLYKQGYSLLQASEYPQSEMKFEEAVTYRISKKWFFNYARGYREHRQYQRAGVMYQKLLQNFKHDKTAGLEYADMELNDLANYERAEEIVRREVLDYHINDPEGILKLGDIFLEWGTAKDSSKLEDAREQYATLIQLYKPNDLYLSRMMRYFIRSDNLRQVIQMKSRFEPREKSLAPEDWTELSGYLLEKYYGTLAPSDEYLRYKIEGLRGLLLRSVKLDQDNPIALYNLAKYFIQSGETNGIEKTLLSAIDKFNNVQSIKKRDIYKYIDSYRLLGEYYIDTTDYLQAQEQFAEGISLYTTERDNAGFEGTADIGKLYADMGNIKYSISGDYDEALMNYKYSVELENDTPSIRYRIGYIQYKNSNYVEALGSFMKAGDGNIKQRNLLLAMANTLVLRGDDYAAQGYYNQLIDNLDSEIAKRGIVFPQANAKDFDVVNTYLSAANNYGVTLYKLAKRTGNSGLNAKAIVQFQQSLRAWDALTRNQETMVRLGGSNLAEQNIQYISHPVPAFEPSIYTDIAKTLLDNEHL